MAAHLVMPRGQWSENYSVGVLAMPKDQWSVEQRDDWKVVELVGPKVEMMEQHLAAQMVERLVLPMAGRME